MAEIDLTKKRQTSRFEGAQAQLASGKTDASASDHARVFGYLIRTIEIENPTGGSDAILTVEGGFRRSDDTIDWYTLATRDHGGDTYSTDAITVATNDAVIVEVSPTPVTDYIRVLVSDATASGLNVWVHVEV